METVLRAAVNMASVLLLAPLLDGLMRKLVALVQSRKGPPVTQSYLDLLKLLGKEDIESGDVPAAQRLAPVLALGAVLTAACFIPMGVGIPLQQQADGIVLIYVLTLCGAATAFAGLAAGSTYSLIGTSREVMSMMFLEPLFATVVIVGYLHTRTLSLDTLLNGSVYGPSGVVGSGLVLLVVLAIAFQAFVQRAPFDITEAETEIMEGPLMEYSGPKLALFRWAHMAKLAVYGSVFLGFFLPWGSTGPAYVAWPLHWLKLVALALLVALVAAVHARLRMDQALRRYAILYAASLTAVVLASWGY